jgi:hypothetical protein
MAWTIPNRAVKMAARRSDGPSASAAVTPASSEETISPLLYERILTDASSFVDALLQ